MHNADGGARRVIDTSVAHSARVHDYWLGGKDNFAADRAAGDAVIQAYPGPGPAMAARIGDRGQGPFGHVGRRGGPHR